MVELPVNWYSQRIIFGPFMDLTKFLFAGVEVEALLYQLYNMKFRPYLLQANIDITVVGSEIVHNREI